MISMNTHLATTSLVVKEPGVIRVRAVLNEEMIRLGSIRVLRAPQAPDHANPSVSFQGSAPKGAI